MKPLSLKVEVTTDKRTGEVLAAYFRIRKGRSSRVVEMANGAAFADYDKHGMLLRIEFLEPCKVSVLNQIEIDKSERGQVKDFVRKSGPRALVLA